MNKRTRTRLKAAPAQLSYYFYLVSTSDGTELYVVMSSLRRNLTERLLLFASSDGVEGRQVIGYAKDIEFKPGVPASLPSRFVRIGFFVEPRKFCEATRTPGGDALWNLLEEEDARALLAEWREDPRYRPKDGSNNYYKNAVDNFEHDMEKRWSHTTT